MHSKITQGTIKITSNKKKVKKKEKVEKYPKYEPVGKTVTKSRLVQY